MYSQKRKYLRLKILEAIVFALAVFGTNLQDQFNLQLKEETIRVLVIILVIFYIYLFAQKKSVPVHELKEDSRQFRRFFQQWYSKPGQHIIFSASLSWMTPEPILNALVEKRNDIVIYCIKPEPAVKALLESKGLRVSIVTDHINSRHRFSIIRQDGVDSIIVRNKDHETDKIVFIETDNYKDPYLISFALDVVREIS